MAKGLDLQTTLDMAWSSHAKTRLLQCNLRPLRESLKIVKPGVYRLPGLKGCGVQIPQGEPSLGLTLSLVIH